MTSKLMIGVIIATGLFSACSHTSDKTRPASQPAGGAPQAEQKKGDTSKTGVISQAGETFFLTVAGQSPEEIDSYAVDLSQYVGQTVTVTGQYSGDTLFVGQIQ